MDATLEKILEALNRICAILSKQDGFSWPMIIQILSVAAACVIPLVVVRHQIAKEKAISENRQLQDKLYEYATLIETMSPFIIPPTLGQEDLSDIQNRINELLAIKEKLHIFDAAYFCNYFEKDIMRLAERLISPATSYFAFLQDKKLFQANPNLFQQMYIPYVNGYTKNEKGLFLTTVCSKVYMIDTFRKSIEENRNKTVSMLTMKLAEMEKGKS